MKHVNFISLRSACRVKISADGISADGDHLHELSKPILWEKDSKKNITNMSSVELTHRVIKVIKGWRH